MWIKIARYVPEKNKENPIVLYSFEIYEFPNKMNTFSADQDGAGLWKSICPTDYNLELWTDW